MIKIYIYIYFFYLKFNLRVVNEMHLTKPSPIPIKMLKFQVNKFYIFCFRKEI